MNFVKKAEQIARKAHAGQYRWDGKTEYITHPEAVVKRIQSQNYDEIRKAPWIAAAWLHDVIEDCNITIIDLLEAGIPEKVVLGVLTLTKRKNESYLNYILRVNKSELASIVKVEDIRHNLLGLSNKNNKQMINKYELAKYILEN